jgi:beta-N-acetylhexosaminidase
MIHSKRRNRTFLSNDATAPQKKKTKSFHYPAIAVLTILLVVMAMMFACPSSSEENWVDKTLNELTLREKIAQLVQIRVPGKFINRQSPEFLAIMEEVEKNHIGGVCLFAGNVSDSAILLNQLQGASRLPLLVSSDFERGASFRIADTTSFPWTMALGAAGSEQLAYRKGLVTAKEARALGVHWIFAPVVDVNNNPANPVINIRSFGEDPDLVARLSSAFIRGAIEGGVLTTAKHFPGHGDTATDSHIGLPVLEMDLSRLRSVEFVPFRSAIEAGVDSIMTAHVAVPRVTGDPRLPATMSPMILNDILRHELGFEGLVVTDALEMAGITDYYWNGLAAVRAIQAGADVLLLPTDATVAINEVERAVRRGQITEARIDESVRKVLNAKYRLQLHKKRLVELDRIGEIVAASENRDDAQEIADRSITVVKDDMRLLPINPLDDKRVFSLVLAPGTESNPGSVFQTEMRRRLPSLRTAWGNSHITSELLTSIDREVAAADIIVCATLVRLTTGQVSVSMPPNQQRILNRLLASGKPVIWVALGNPYVLQLAPQARTYLSTFSYSDVSQIAAAKAISGAIELTGSMPVSIPGHASTGTGMRIPRLDMTLTTVPPEQAGLRPEVFGIIRTLVSDYVKAGVVDGIQITAGYRGNMIFDHAMGVTGPEGEPVDSDTIFDTVSLATPVNATTAAMLAVDSRRVLFTAQLSHYIPELEGSRYERLTLQNLLSSLSRKERAGEAGYDDFLLETVIHRATGVPLASFVSEHIFTPLGMKRTTSRPTRGDQEKINHDQAPGVPGLSSTARDLSIFAQMLLNRGLYDHQRYCSHGTLTRLTGATGPWTKPSRSDWTGSLSTSAFGHTSSNGSFIWIDPVKQSFFVMLVDAAEESDRIPELQSTIGKLIISALPVR